jgi:hypothetical protein
MDLTVTAALEATYKLRPVIPERQSIGSRLVRTVFVLMLFLSSVFAVYEGTRRYGFVQDDFLFARPLTARQLASTFFGNWEPFGLGNSHYRPVVALTLAADYEIHGVRPRGYHETNLILLSLCGLASFALLRRLGCGSLAAFLASLAWLVHPMSASSAAWCAQRTDSVMAIFYLLAVRAALAPTFARSDLVKVLVFGALALGSKEMAATLPAAIAMALWIFKPVDWRRRILPAAGGTLVLAVALVVIFSRLFPEKTHFYPPPLGHALHMLFPVFWPSSYLHFWNARVPDPRDVCTALVFFAGSAWLAMRHKEQLSLRFAAAALLWPIITLVPVFGLDDPDSYRLGLLPAFGFAFIVAAFAHGFRRHRPILFLAAAGLAIWFVPMARGSAAVWGPGGFQYQSLLKWRAQQAEWQALLTPEMRALFERQVRRDLGADYLRAGAAGPQP